MTVRTGHQVDEQRIVCFCDVERRVPVDRIEDRAAFSYIRYANCWEDTAVLCRALQAAPGKRLLSIASAGDNSLALLATGAEVVAADLSAAQLACVELRLAAITRLGREECLGFLGLRPGADRTAVYAGLRDALSDSARTFWDTQPAEIRRGIVHAGKFERYFQAFRKYILRLIHSRRTINALLAPKDKAARQAFYDNTWATWRWRLLFRLFFSRFVMGRLGRDPEFFKYVTGDVASRILARTAYALTELPTHDNPYLDYILTGNFSHTVPDYLQPECYAGIRANAGNLHLFHGPIQAAAAHYGQSGFDGFNLSDIFEYLDEAASERLYGELLAHARPGARLAYWNMLVPRECPARFRTQMTGLSSCAEALFAFDRAFFYRRFLVEEVR